MLARVVGELATGMLLVKRAARLYSTLRTHGTLSRDRVSTAGVSTMAKISASYLAGMPVATPGQRDVRYVCASSAHSELTI